MKIVALMYLEEDDAAVEQLLQDHGVMAYSRLPLEGHGSGMRGWYGEIAPYRSLMTFALLDEEKAAELLDAVAACTGCKDPRHPIHAMQLHVERAVDSGVSTANAN